MDSSGEKVEPYQLSSSNVGTAAQRAIFAPIFLLTSVQKPDPAELSALSHSSPRLQRHSASISGRLPLSPSSPCISYPASFNLQVAESAARFENVVPPWGASRSQRPLSAKSASPKASASSLGSADSNTTYAHLRSVASGSLDVPLWKFEQQGAAALTDSAFRYNHGKVLKSPRSRQVPCQESGVMRLAIKSSNTQGNTRGPLCSHRIRRLCRVSLPSSSSSPQVRV
jgi:hypothetical protein